MINLKKEELKKILIKENNLMHNKKSYLICKIL